MNRRKIIVITLLCLILFLYGIRLWLITNLTVKSVEYYRLQSQIDEIKKQNAQLYERILHESSFAVLEHKARKAGFIDATYFVLD